MSKKEVGVICSMSYYEMKLMVHSLSQTLLANEIRGDYTARIHALISKLNGMLTKQGFDNA